MIHNGGEFFGSYPKPDTLDTWSVAFPYYGSEKSEYSQWSSKQFYYTQQLFDNPAHIFTAIFEHEAWINDWFYPFYRDGKIVIQTGPALF